MDIIYAAETPSIASLFSDYLQRPVEVEEIKVSENPDETGSFYIGFDLEHYVLSPDGTIENDRLR